MNRRNRTSLVLLVAVGLASLATYGVFRTIKSIPVRQVEVATRHVVIAAKLRSGHGCRGRRSRLSAGRRRHLSREALPRWKRSSDEG